MRSDFVRIRAPARLHLGFLDPSGKGHRRFGGVGLAIDEPATEITVARADRDSIVGPEAERAAHYLGLLRDHMSLSGTCYRLSIDETIPAHSGLGSGTQLALALATAIRTLEGREAAVLHDAALLGRGNRSGLGAAFMTKGGLAVDGGKRNDLAPPPIVAHVEFPEEWRVILVLDRMSEGFHGAAELEAFSALPAFPPRSTDTICRLVLMEALPAIAEADIAAFGSAITTIQEMVGGHFAPAQGGLFTSERVAAACAGLVSLGAHGMGQSSWGPTGFSFAATQNEAEALVARITADGLGDGLELKIVRGRNRGSHITHGTHDTFERRTGTR